MDIVLPFLVILYSPWIEEKKRYKDHVCVVMCPSMDLEDMISPTRRDDPAKLYVSDDHLFCFMNFDVDPCEGEICRVFVCDGRKTSWPCFVSVTVLFPDSPVVGTSPGVSRFKS